MYLIFINQEVAFLVQHKSIIDVGYYQHMVFQDVSGVLLIDDSTRARRHEV